jgi:ATP-dependent protease Clp ATPase subunit
MAGQCSSVQRLFEMDRVNLTLAEEALGAIARQVPAISRQAFICCCLGRLEHF